MGFVKTPLDIVHSHSCQILGTLGSSKEMGGFKVIIWGEESHPSAHHERVLSLSDNAILKIYCKSY